MRALLIVNPHATATTERRRELLTHALAGSTSLRVAQTTHRGHATTLAAAALADDTRLVVVHGGDGTVNETVNGLLSHGTSPSLPLLAVVPGGSTNVFARAIGIEPDPTSATEQILHALPRNNTRTVSVGLADDRYFTFNAGLGLDAAVVRSVEEYRAKGRRISNSLHVRRAISTFFATDRREAHLTLSITDADGHLAQITDSADDSADGGQRVSLATISNVDPWTYMGNRPVRTNPGLPLERDLGVFALRSLGACTVLRALRQLAYGASGARGHAAFRADHVRSVTVAADEPTGLQVDGDYLGERSAVTFRSVPNALQVLV